MKDSLSLAISSNTVSLNLNPAISPFDQETILTTVGTNNPYGYKLYLNSSTTSLVRDNSDGYFPVGSEPVIETLSSTTDGYTESNFPANRWGYKLGSGNYFPFASGLLISSSDTATTTANTTSVTFGAKVDYEKPAGNYNMTLNFTAVAGVSPAPAMQDFTKAEATAMSEGDTRTLRDLRDDQEYSVAKIGGTVWMTKNLNIAGGTTLTSATSNVSSDYTLPDSSTSGFSDNATAYVYNSGRTDCSSSPGCYSYYSYVAATAGTNPSSGNATSDICPKGWRLPTQTEFNALVSSYNTGAKLTASPFLAVYGGHYSNSSFYNGGSYGYYWSSTTDSSTDALYLFFGSGDAHVYGTSRRLGLSVRCVFETRTIADFTNMQDVTKAAAVNTAIGATATLKDTRDNQEYSVAKLEDGNLWMTRNLAIGCNGSGSSYGSGRTTRSLTSSDSNVSDTWSTSSAENINRSNTSETSGYTTAAMQCSSTYGAWYNYKAATAGTISGNPNTTNAIKDICPSGWRLPTLDEFSGITSSASAFSPVTGGRYYNGSLGLTGLGFWWSATAGNGTGRYDLRYDGSSLGNGSCDGRYLGFSVRCIKS